MTAHVWIHVGPLNFQPGEIAKIALAVFFAGFLVARRDSLAMVGRKVLGVRLPARPRPRAHPRRLGARPRR